MLLGIASGALLGAFALPMKMVRRWRWENTWLVYCVSSLLFLPWILAFFTVPDLVGVMRSVAFGSLFWPFLFGFGWGIGCVLFGLGLKLVGLALGTAIVLGLNNALGAILPLVLFHRSEVHKSSGQAILAGVAIMLLGVVRLRSCGKQERTGIRNSKPDGENGSAKRASGVLICIAGGVFGTCFNLALVFGTELRDAALHAGATQLNANNPVWCIPRFGGLLANFGFCAYLLTKNSTWSLFNPQGSKLEWMLAIAMGVMWMGGVAIYGMSVEQLGRLGASIGWALIQSTAIVSGNLCGLATGEWQGAGSPALRAMGLGLALLLAGICVVGWSATL